MAPPVIVSRVDSATAVGRTDATAACSYDRDGRWPDPSPLPHFRTSDPMVAARRADLLGPMNRLLRRLLATPCEELVFRGRVRMRRLACAGCRRQTWVVVGPPRCSECARGAAQR